MGDLAGGRAPLDADDGFEAVHQQDVARIADSVRDVVDAHAALISRVVDADRLEVLAVSGSVHGPDPTGTRWSRTDLERYLEESEGRGRIRVTTRRAVSYVDVPDDAPFAAGGSTILLVPLLSDDELVGVLATVGYLDLDGLTDETRALVELYADQARLAIDVLREHRLLQDHRRMSEAAESLVYATLAEPDQASLVTSVAEPLTRLMRADAGWVCADLASPSDDHPADASYPSDVAGRLGPEVGPLVEPLVVRAWSQGVALSEDEEPVLGRIAGLLDRSRAMLAAIGSRDEARGALLVLRGADDDAWTAQERETLAGLGRRLGWVVDQLESRSRDRTLVAELEEIDQHRRDLVASLTHDLKTPLTAISLNAELLEADDTAPGAHPVTAIRRSAERLSKLVDDLLALARAEEGVAPTGADSTTATSVDAVALVHEACRHVEGEAQLRRVRFVLDLPQNLEVAVDGVALARVYVNVIDNAVKYSLPGGEVRISLRAVDGWVEMTCADDGVGIADADRDAVFDMFRRARDSDERGVRGSGVGLAISHRIVTRLGGTIELASAPGAGSTFVVRVPTGERPQ